uniref:Gfo/Idh/MocA-like oxidoreductase N-terminal domain-containing protein n=1 Tax=Timspurckia oligopyrenoides TaxID=708627 RepID=A0A7S0ZGF9_9RHOD|mmetsp:Transcript_4265/g.7476  ORF Transcript_4265/g.7476 Transcript_4265/m.7476 type:complete len:594 (+) Transcript_4265:72-1853(+)
MDSIRYEIGKRYAGLLKVGVIGCGKWGQNHVRALHEMNLLSAVSDLNSSTLSELNSRFNLAQSGVSISSDPYANIMQNSADTHAVIIASPTNTHAQLAKECLLAGKHVFVEKPISMDSKEVRELMRLAAERQLVLMTGHIVLFDRAFERMLRLIENGLIGVPRYISATRLSLGTFRNDADVLWTLAPHDIAMIDAVLARFSQRGSAVVHNCEMHVTAASGSCVFSESRSDAGTITLRCGTRFGEVHALVSVSWLHAAKERKFIVHGEHGSLEYDALNPDQSQALRHHRHHVAYNSEAKSVQVSRSVSNESGNPFSHDQTASEKERFADSLTMELDHFLECIIEERLENKAGGQQALRVVTVLEEAHRLIEAAALGSRNVTQHAGKESLNQENTVDNVFVHDSAYVDANVTLCSGVKLWHFVHVMSGAKIGSESSLGQNVFVGKGVDIGRGVKVQNNVSIYEGVSVADHVFIGPSVVFTNVRNPRSEINRRADFASTRLCKGVTVGANATIVCGITVGEYAFIGAGSVVTKDVAPFTLVYGNPATCQGYVSPLGYRLNEKSCGHDGEKIFSCSETGREFMLSPDGTRMSERVSL